MKKAIIISYYRWWESRQCYFAKWLMKKEYEIEYLTADFDHISKKYINNENLPEFTKKIHVPSYNNNLSLKRIFSNIIFSKKVNDYLNEYNPDVIVCLIPTNFLGITLKKYKKKNENVKILIDILDLWPETLPINSIIKRFLFVPFYVWKNMRNQALKCASFVFFECELFKNEINKKSKLKDYEILYLQNSNKNPIKLKNIMSEINFVYLGSINNIVDIDRIVNFIASIGKKRKINLEIIGCGSSEDYFVNLSQKNGINVIFHGKVFDQNKKREIFERCHFGINIMKSSVFVGLTTKSIDYIANNIPLINSIPGDTELLLNKYKAGYNIINNENEVVEKMVNMNQEEYNQLVYNSNRLFCENFSTEIFEKKLSNILEKIV